MKTCSLHTRLSLSAPGRERVGEQVSLSRGFIRLPPVCGFLFGRSGGRDRGVPFRAAREKGITLRADESRPEAFPFTLGENFLRRRFAGPVPDVSTAAAGRAAGLGVETHGQATCGQSSPRKR